MARRPASLLVIALACGLGAVTVSNARAGRPSTPVALAAYNAGPTAVTNARGAPSDETLTYIADVMSIWRSLAGCN